MSSHRTGGQRRSHLPLNSRVSSRVGSARDGAPGADGGQGRRGRFRHFECGGDRSDSRAGRIWTEERRTMARISRTILHSTEPARRAIATLALTVLLALAASEAHASIAFVKNIGTNMGNNASSITITLAAGVSVAPGESIIGSFVGEDLSGTYTATDSAGNTYSQNASGAKSGTVRTVILSAHNVKA